MSIDEKGESMSEEIITLELYKKYVDGLLSSNDLPAFAKSYQLECDREYKSYTYLTINYHGKSYNIKNGEVKVGDKKYSLSENRIQDPSISKYGYLLIGGEKVAINHSGKRYADLSEGARYKVNRNIARAMAYIESKKLTSQISHFAEKTNSTNPPYDELFDECVYHSTDIEYRISSFKSFVKTKFDQQANMDFGHNTLNLYGLKKLIEYKQNIIESIKNNQCFDEDVYEDFSNQALTVMAQNSDILLKTIFESANNLDMDNNKIGQLTNISEKTAKSFLNQLSVISGDPMFVKRLGDAELYTDNKSKSNNEMIDYTPTYSIDEDDEPTILVDENGYTVSLDGNGNYINNATGKRYYGTVYSEDGCPVYDPKEEYHLLKVTCPSKKQPQEKSKNDKSKNKYEEDDLDFVKEYKPN